MSIDSHDSERQRSEYTLQFRRFFDKPAIESKLLLCALASTSAHVEMLGHTGIIDLSASNDIVNCLAAMISQAREGHSFFKPEDNDVYDAIERSLKNTLGETANLIRTAKSKNDQTATDLRLYLRGEVLDLAQRILDLRKLFLQLSSRDITVVMPGYTHMQPAEAILLSHWWLMNECRFARDFSRLLELFSRINRLPLGACVMAGSREPIDRNFVAQKLGFDEVMQNSLDAVTDRDYQIEFGACASLIGLHFSQLGSELLLWATREFAFITLPRHLTVHSNNMPFKRNPELLEVLRARPALIFGRLMEFITELKAVPTGFSQDLQESIPGLADVAETLRLLIELSVGILPGIEPDEIRMKEVACADLVNVGNALDYLLEHGVEKDIAIRAVEHLTTYCRNRNKYLSDLSLSEWQTFSPAFEVDIYDHVSMEESIGAYCSFGGSSTDQVELAMQSAREALQRDELRLTEQKNKAPAL